MTRPPSPARLPSTPPGRFVPTGQYRGSLDEFDYVEEEWFATGEVDGHPYATALTVRRPRDPSRFSGTVMVEPVHAASAAPMWIYTSTYQMRAGHGWAAVCSQKTVLDGFVKPTNAERYASLDIWSDAPPLEAAGIEGMRVPRDPAGFQARMERMRAVNVLSTPILAQVGAALTGDGGPFAGLGVRRLVLTGHSQTGAVVTDYILNGHDAQRHGDGSPVYGGFFPSGAPSVRFEHVDVPIVQVLSDGDIADPNRPGREGRRYRRDDSDDPGDRYRLYELAGVGHMGTRYPPYSDNAMWQNDPLGTAGERPAGCGHEQPAPRRALRHGPAPPGALGGGRRGPAAGRAHRGGARRPLRQGRVRQQPRRRALRADGRPPVALLLHAGRAGGRDAGLRRGRDRGALPAETLARALPGPRRLRRPRSTAGWTSWSSQGWFLAEDTDEMRAEAKGAAVP